MIGKRIAQSALAWSAVLIASAVLVGYLLDIPLLHTPVDALLGRPPSVIGMAPTTAIVLIILGAERIIDNLRK